jgi:hypothetical protein
MNHSVDALVYERNSSQVKVFRASAVGTPVTRRPRRNPGRAVFPHPVPRLYSLIKRTFTVTR